MAWSFDPSTAVVAGTEDDGGTAAKGGEAMRPSFQLGHDAGDMADVMEQQQQKQEHPLLPAELVAQHRSKSKQLISVPGTDPSEAMESLRERTLYYADAMGCIATVPQNPSNPFSTTITLEPEGKDVNGESCAFKCSVEMLQVVVPAGRGFALLLRLLQRF